MSWGLEESAVSERDWSTSSTIGWKTDATRSPNVPNPRDMHAVEWAVQG